MICIRRILNRSIHIVIRRRIRFRFGRIRILMIAFFLRVCHDCVVIVL